MKTLYSLLIVIVLSSFSCISTDNKEQKKIHEFLTEMADARLMDREEGRLAATRGTTQEIRDYGNYMVKDQTLLLDALTRIAATKNVALPQTISEEKSKALDKLKEKTGSAFDKKFLKMIKIDHKRDVRKFKKAKAFKDAETSAFATKYLPTIEQHLMGVEKIKAHM